MYTKDYIQATYEVLKDSTDSAKLLNALREYLKKRGLSKLHAPILRGLLEKMRRSTALVKPKVLIAREKDLKEHSHEINVFFTKHLFDTDHSTEIDETLIGGFIIEAQNIRVDKSHKNKLLQAYQRLTRGN